MLKKADAVIAQNSIREHIMRRVKPYLDQLGSDSLQYTKFLELLQAVLRLIDPQARQQLRSVLSEDAEQFERIISESLKNLSEMAVEYPNPSVISTAVELSSSFLQNSIRYLGPLRDEPKPIYPLEALGNPTDVGYKGEHTAAVLDLNRERRVLYIPSNYVDNLVDAEIETAPLYVAVVDWLAYLGIAENIKTEDLGKMGHQLHVRVDQLDKEHDLTNVGVGVSQVLPIIVMSLLAPSGSMLIFEQPELHLHPRVQSRLADFFLSMCLTQRQCLLETHSEHLIQRLRRRSAEAEEATISSKIKIYFTQKKGQSTVCEHVQVTKYGAIKNWPSDFFDQSQSETEKILMAAQEKFQKENAHRGRVQ